MSAAPRKRTERRPRPTRVVQTQVGDIQVRRTGRRIDWSDPYHVAVSLTWPQFALLFLTLHLSINLIFATLYWVQPGSVANARPGSFFDAFFFSVETLATVGYGVFAPASGYGHVVATAEIISGMAFTAIMTGLTFVRFARPRAKVVYASKAVVTRYNGKPILMLRIGNGRPNPVDDAVVRLTALLAEEAEEGTTFRRTHELRLLRSRLPVFALTWTLMHEIDETSPLRGCGTPELQARDLRMFVSFEGHDAVLASTVRDVRTYSPEDVMFGYRYVDIIGPDESGQTVADLTRIDEIEPDGR